MYTIEIRNGKQSTLKVKDKLKEEGFHFAKVGIYTGYWHKETNDEIEIRKWKKFCKNRFLYYVYDKSMHTRKSNYREVYLKAHKPDSNGKFHCVYCGRTLNEEELTVDHIISVYNAKTNWHYQKILDKKYEGNVNHPDNLAATCPRCNLKKGPNTSGWVLKGKLGKHREFWAIVDAFHLLIMIIVLFAESYILYKNFVIFF